MTIIGLDVAFASVGYGVFEQDLAEEFCLVRAGTLHPPAKKDHLELQYAADINFHRSQAWYLMIVELLQEESPKVVFMELPHGGAQNAKAMSMMAMSVALMAAVAVVRTDIVFLPVTPTEVKKAGVGKSSGTKEEMMTAGLNMYPNLGTLVPRKGDLEHACDAALAVKAGLSNAQYLRHLKQFSIL